MITSQGMMLERIVSDEGQRSANEQMVNTLYRLASDRITPRGFGEPTSPMDSAEMRDSKNTVTPSNDNNQKSIFSSGDRPTKRSGRWSLDEKILFLYGLRRFGKGRWKKISIYLPDRSLVQIKSHAQKVLKRLESGENVYRRLHENVARTDALVQAIHGKYGLDSPEWWTSKRKVQDAADVAEQFDAASALCQLSSHSLSDKTTISNQST